MIDGIDPSIPEEKARHTRRACERLQRRACGGSVTGFVQK